MDNPAPAFLLENSDLITPAAPWCVWLDNLELSILLLAQPWSGDGLRRAELEHQITRLAADLPVGPVYFQRVNRAVAALERRGQLVGLGSGRDRRFVLTGRGFAALILNLQVLRSDPTLDGSEFELKRALVALWNLVVDQVLDSPQDLAPDTKMSVFFAELNGLELLGRPAISDTTIADAFDILRLIDTQRIRVRQLEEAARKRFSGATRQQEMLGKMPAPRPGNGPALSAADAITAVRHVAAGAAPRMAAAAQILRYGAYLCYLDELTTLYAKELRVVDLSLFFRAMV